MSSIPIKSTPTETSRPHDVAKKCIYWKELRQGIPVFVVFTLLMLGTIGLIEYIRSFQGAGTRPPSWSIYCWLYFSMYSLAVGLLLYAPEKEHRTIDVLRHLPVSSRYVVFRKLLFAVAALAAFLVLGCLLQLFEVIALQATISEISFKNFWMRFGSVAHVLMLPIDCFIFASVCSLAMKRTLPAAFVTLGLVVLSFAIPKILLSYTDISPEIETTQYFIAFSAAKVFMYVVAAIVFVSLSGSWLRKESSFRLGNALLRPRKKTQTREATVEKNESGTKLTSAPKQGVYRSLIWQSFRQYSFMGIFLLGMAAIYVVIALTTISSTNVGVPPSRTYEVLFSRFFPGFMFVISLVAGLATFSADHRRDNYRFFQQHGEYPRKLWLVRLLPGLLPTLVCSLLLFIRFYLEAPESANFHSLLFLAAFCAALTLAPFAVGQFYSLIYRSYVFAIIASLILLGLLTTAITYLAYLIAPPYSAWLILACIVPIVTSLFTLSWWWIPKWISGRNEAIDKARPQLMLYGVMIVVASGFAYYRATEPPATQFSLKEESARYETELFSGSGGTGALTEIIKEARFQDSEANWAIAQRLRNVFVAKTFSEFSDMSPDTADSILQEVIQDLDAAETAKNGRDKAILRRFVEANKNAIELLHTAEQLEKKSLLSPEGSDKRGEQLTTMRMLIAAEAHLAEENSNLEEALNHWLRLVKLEEDFPLPNVTQPAMTCLIRWAELPSQDPKLIRKAMDEIQLTETRWQRIAERTEYFHLLDFENWYETYSSQITFLGGQNKKTDETVDESAMPTMPAFPYREGGWPFAWERERSRRAAHVSIRQIRQKFQALQPLLTDNDKYAFALFNNQQNDNLEKELRSRTDSQWNTPIRTNPLRESYDSIPDWHSLATSNFLRDGAFTLKGYHGPSEVGMIVDIIQRRRYTKIRLALAAWRIDNENYPSELQELVPDYIDQVPSDAILGKQFTYSSTGTPMEVAWPSPWNCRLASDNGVLTDYETRPKSTLRSHAPDLLPWIQCPSIPENTPFLLAWSAVRSPQEINGRIFGSGGLTGKYLAYEGYNENWLLGLPKYRYDFDYALPAIKAKKP